MDLKLIISGAFALVCVLIAATYKEPKAYHEIMKPLLKWIALGTMIVGIGVMVGNFMMFNSLIEYIPPAKADMARKVANSYYDTFMFYVLISFFFLVLDVALFVIALKSADWKEKELTKL